MALHHRHKSLFIPKAFSTKVIVSFRFSCIVCIYQIPLSGLTKNKEFSHSVQWFVIYGCSKADLFLSTLVFTHKFYLHNFKEVCPLLDINEKFCQVKQSRKNMNGMHKLILSFLYNKTKTFMEKKKCFKECNVFLIHTIGQKYTDEASRKSDL